MASFERAARKNDTVAAFVHCLKTVLCVDINLIETHAASKQRITAYLRIIYPLNLWNQVC